MLESAGIRPTRQRKLLASLLFNTSTERHVTAEQLYREANQGLKQPVSIATVYNTLNQFVDAGLLSERHLPDGSSFFDINPGKHYHFRFEPDGRLRDIPETEIELCALPSLPDGYEIDQIDITINLRPIK